MRLEQALVIDDERFAVEFARDKRNLAGWGRARIGAALSERGVPGYLIEVALDGDGPSEAERARDLLLSKGYGLDDPAERQRALGFLGRKGFTAEDSYEALRLVGRAEGLDPFE